MSKAIFKSCDTRRPGAIPTLPGSNRTTAKSSDAGEESGRRDDAQFVTLECFTSTPLATPVVPAGAEINT